MPSVIDALVVTLGLDAKGYLAQAAAARAERKKLSAEEAAAAKDAETFAKRRTEAYTSFRGELRRVAAEAASLFAVFTAGKSLTTFIQDITTGDAATGRLAKNLGMATGDLAAWERAVERAGGTAAGFDATISGLSREVQTYQLTGQSGGMLSYFRALGVQLTGTSEDLLKISGVVSGMNRQQATALMSGAGIDQGTQNLLLEGTAKVRAALEEAKKLGVPSDKDAQNAQDLLANIMKVRQAVEDTVRVILNQFGPSINQALAEFTVWITVNGPRLKNEIADRITWIVSEVRSFITSANEAAAAVGGWVDISEALFAMWAVSKVAGLIKAVATVGGVFAVGAELAARVAPALAPLALIGPAGGEDPEFSKRKNDEYLRDHPRSNAGKAIANALPTSMGGTGADRREQDSFIDRLSRAIGKFMGHETHLDTGTGTEGVTPSEAHGKGFGAGPQLGASAPALPGGDQMARAQQAHAYFVSQGWTPEQSAGIVANLHKESRFNTGAVGDTGSAYGIAQWHPDRRAALQKMTGRSLVGASFEQQLEAVHLELTKGQEQAAGNALRQTRTAREAGAAVSRLYERPKARDQEALERGGLAERFNVQFGPAGARPAATPPPAMNPQRVSALRWGNTMNSTSNDNSSSTHVGSVTIQTAATDARGIAGSFKEAMTGMGLAAQANTGLS